MNDSVNNLNSSTITFNVVIPGEEAGGSGDGVDMFLSPLQNKIRDNLMYFAFVGGFMFILMCILIVFYVNKNIKKKK
jgi:hypothetical protein